MYLATFEECAKVWLSMLGKLALKLYTLECSSYDALFIIIILAEYTDILSTSL